MFRTLKSELFARNLQPRIQRYSQGSINNIYKHAMTGVPATAMVITTNKATKSGLNEPRGLTVSSVTSLSINPSPLISFNLQLPSRTSEILHERGIFAVNVLRPCKDSIAIARAFAGGYGRDVNPFELEKDLIGYTNSNDPYHDIPFLHSSMAVFYCKKHSVFKAQDHEIWVASVDRVECEKDVKDGSLIYQNHLFHSLGPNIEH